MTNVIIFPRRQYKHRQREFAIGAAATMCGIFGWAFVAYVIVDCATHLVRGRALIGDLFTILPTN